MIPAGWIEEEFIIAKLKGDLCKFYWCPLIGGFKINWEDYLRNKEKYSQDNPYFTTETFEIYQARQQLLKDRGII